MENEMLEIYQGIHKSLSVITVTAIVVGWVFILNTIKNFFK